MIRSVFLLSWAAIYSNISDYPTYHNIISIKKNYNKSATVNVHYNMLSPIPPSIGRASLIASPKGIKSKVSGTSFIKHHLIFRKSSYRYFTEIKVLMKRGDISTYRIYDFLMPPPNRETAHPSRTTIRIIEVKELSPLFYPLA